MSIGTWCLFIAIVQVKVQVSGHEDEVVETLTEDSSLQTAQKLLHKILPVIGTSLASVLYGRSLYWYFLCEDAESLYQLRVTYNNGKLIDYIREVCHKVCLVNETVQITVEWSYDDYLKCSSWFLQQQVHSMF